MSKAGVGLQSAVGTAIPNPEKCVALRFLVDRILMSSRSIPHASSHSTQQTLSTSPATPISPVRESALSMNKTGEDEQPFLPAESAAPTPVATSTQE